MTKHNDQPDGPANERPASTGNASNSSPHGAEPHKEQLLNEKAEKYIREAGNIEDMPDAEDEEATGFTKEHN
jgi:hypothetical protein